MRKILALVLLLSAAGAAGAQVTVPIPPFVRTFKAVSLTRGLYFQAPAALTVVAVRVPDEGKHGKQNVAVYWRDTEPPAHAVTATGGLRFVAVDRPSSLWLPCHVTYNAGDWVGILGACGDRTVLNTSYGGANGFRTTVLGKTTTLWRLLSQTNLVTTRGRGPYSSERAYDIGRVEFQVVPAAELASRSFPRTGGTILFTLSSPQDPGLAYQAASSLGTGPTPIGMGRKLWLTVDPLMILTTSGLASSVFRGYAGKLDSRGQAYAVVQVPNAPALKGVTFATAYVVLRAGAPAGIIRVSGTMLTEMK
jgi:hypothetical protein